MPAANEILAVLGVSTEDALITAGSAAVVALMVAVAYIIGFRTTARLSEAEVASLAAAEGASVESAIVDPKGRAAVARLGGGGLLFARVMGDGIGARVAPAGKVKVSLGKDRVSVRFGDLGFPPLRLRIAGEAPQWLKQLAARE